METYEGNRRKKRTNKTNKNLNSHSNIINNLNNISNLHNIQQGNYQMTDKEFENKTFFSTELNMLGKKKSSPMKYIKIN